MDTYKVINSTLKINEGLMDDTVKLRFARQYTDDFMLSPFDTGLCERLLKSFYRYAQNHPSIPQVMLIANKESPNDERSVLAFVKPVFQSLHAFSKNQVKFWGFFLELYNNEDGFTRAVVSDAYKDLLRSMIHALYTLMKILDKHGVSVSVAPHHIFIKEDPPLIAFAKFYENAEGVSWNELINIINDISESFNLSIREILQTHLTTPIQDIINDEDNSKLETRDLIIDLPIFWTWTRHKILMNEVGDILNHYGEVQGQAHLESSDAVLQAFEDWRDLLYDTNVGSKLFDIHPESFSNLRDLFDLIIGLRNVVAHHEGYYHGENNAKKAIQYMNYLWPSHLTALIEWKNQHFGQ